MHVTNIREAKANLSKLVDRAAAGEEIVIAKAGKPVARLVPYQELKTLDRRKPDAMKGKIWMSPDFDKADEEIEALFYGNPIEPST